MKKQILSIAILATLPLTAMAENISGAMYVAPMAATQNNPAPTTNALAPYGRINIDTADQQNIASTAYVKGAYNSAIAAVNRKLDTASVYDSDMIDERVADIQNGMVIDNSGRQQLNSQVASAYSVIDTKVQVANKQDKFEIDDEDDGTDNDISSTLVGSGEFVNGINSGDYDGGYNWETRLPTAYAVARAIDNKRVEIYTTWDNDNAKQQVEFVNAPAN